MKLIRIDTQKTSLTVLRNSCRCCKGDVHYAFGFYVEGDALKTYCGACMMHGRVTLGHASFTARGWNCQRFGFGHVRMFLNRGNNVMTLDDEGSVHTKLDTGSGRVYLQYVSRESTTQ